jgi:cyclophilin family peptidyl-prolyl cis-trans isomerase/predicted GIY-YIG superfamily endonuclease
MPKPAFYVLECEDGSYYAGYTTDLARRLRSHRRGVASRYTRSRLPIRLIAWSFTEDARAARSAEATFKGYSRAEKDRLLAGDEAFGRCMHKPPSLTTISTPEVGNIVASLQPPQADELPALVETARTSQARLTTDKGDIVFTFYPDDAPGHAAAFIKLVQAGFYDGLKFHRVEPNFVVQGGDPDGNGTGGPGYRLKAEFNDRPHVRGTVAMARSSQPDSGGSQFYICLDDARFLDKQYTVFGQMTDGFDALDAIRVGDSMGKVVIEPKVAS